MTSSALALSNGPVPGVPAVRCLGPARLTAGLDRYRRLDLRTHLGIHGRMLPLTVSELVGLAERISLRGRGGAGFPFGRKVRAVVESAQRRRSGTVVVVNATEGEPASWKDKVLLARAPHLILDGAALAARALGADGIVVGVADDGIGEESMIRALAERQMPAPTQVVTMPHRFISGEGGALVRGINGEVPIPPGRKTRASDSGVGGLPTLLSNAETYAQLAIAGGFHGKWMSPEAAAQARVSRESLDALGGTLGAGIILPLGEGTCPLGEVTRVVHYLAGQSAGQCGPCRMGLPDLARTIAMLADGSGGRGSVDAIRAAAGGVRGRGACSHPDGTASFALSALETFTADVDAHVKHDGCGQQTQNVLPLPVEEAGAGARLAVDWARCDGHGLCAHIVPELIRLDGNGFPSFPDTLVPPWLEAEAQKAVRMCPALALRLTSGDRKGADSKAGANGRRR